MGNADFDTINELYKHYYQTPIPSKYEEKWKHIEMMPSKLVNLRKHAENKNHFLQLIKEDLDKKDKKKREKREKKTAKREKKENNKKVKK
jgi:hypothetical protein